jgi:hypothetical protein
VNGHGYLSTVAEFRVWTQEIDQMTAAYEDALRVLRLANRSDPLTDLVAQKIIEVAQTGQRDPMRMRELALEALGVPPGQGDS